jgi:hypothetical protein
MADYPFLLQLQVILTANAQGTMTFIVPQQETLEIKQIRIFSTGIFIINDIRDSFGRHYTNANLTVGVDSRTLQSGGSGNIGMQDWPIPLIIEKGTTLYIDVKDTSAGGNTISLLLPAIRHTEGQT